MPELWIKIFGIYEKVRDRGEDKETDNEWWMKLVLVSKKFSNAVYQLPHLYISYLCWLDDNNSYSRFTHIESMTIDNMDKGPHFDTKFPHLEKLKLNKKFCFRGMSTSLFPKLSSLSIKKITRTKELNRLDQTLKKQITSLKIRKLNLVLIDDIINLFPSLKVLKMGSRDLSLYIQQRPLQEIHCFSYDYPLLYTGPCCIYYSELISELHPPLHKLDGPFYEYHHARGFMYNGVALGTWYFYDDDQDTPIFSMYTK
jgi:hypothetical protein